MNRDTTLATPPTVCACTQQRHCEPTGLAKRRQLVVPVRTQGPINGRLLSSRDASTRPLTFRNHDCRGVWLPDCARDARLSGTTSFRIQTPNTRPRSRGTDSPRFACRFPLNKEGAGNAGCALHPRSRVQRVERKAHTSIQGSGEHPTFPAQWLDGLWRAHPGEFMAFVASVASRKPAPGPVGPAPPQDLTPTSFRHRVHTLLPYASAPLVNTFQNRSRSLPALLVLFRARCRRVHRNSCPNVR